MKRFQECSFLEKLWRYRWYLSIPFLYAFHQFFKPLKVYEDQFVDDKIVRTNNYEVIKGDELWKILVGVIQGKMNWYYTSEEVFKGY